MIYLDNASTTQVAPEVFEAMKPYLTEQYGNPGTLYTLGRKAAEAIKIAREQVAEFIAAKPEQIIFTSGGSEANSLVFEGVARHLEKLGKHHIIISAVEHDSVIKAAKEMCIKHDFYLSFLPVNRLGVVSVDELEKMITDDTGLVSVMYVNNETGAINPVNEIGAFCKSKHVLFHTDCVQAAGFQNINVGEIGCDFASFSSHKIHGAKGTGALFAKDPETISPIIHGGSVQEFGKRGGTENVAGIVGFGKACELSQVRLGEIVDAVSKCKTLFYDILIENLNGAVESDAITVNGDIADCGKTLNLTIKNIDGETLVLLADSNGVCISSGSACRSHESEPSHVLLAMGLTADEARDSIRISFSDYNTKTEVCAAAKIIAECIRLCTMPFGTVTLFT